MAAAVAEQPAEFDCKTCLHKHCDNERALPGSTGPAPFDMWQIVDPEDPNKVIFESAVCPLPVIGDRIWQLFRLYRHFEKGVLLNGGGLADQPHRYLEQMNLIDRALKHG